ncbi:hypothetical protein GOV04_00410 [Candidatus Woesearchaeota archaeon]|nr:hypothetical protein [Candidatus Woesearchaeota archaeon]
MKTLFDQTSSKQAHLYSKLCLVFSFILPPLAIFFGVKALKKMVQEYFGGRAITNAGLLISTMPYPIISLTLLYYFEVMNSWSLLFSFVVPMIVTIYAIKQFNKLLLSGQWSRAYAIFLTTLLVLVMPLSIVTLIAFAPF